MRRHDKNMFVILSWQLGSLVLVPGLSTIDLPVLWARFKTWRPSCTWRCHSQLPTKTPTDSDTKCFQDLSGLFSREGPRFLFKSPCLKAPLPQVWGQNAKMLMAKPSTSQSFWWKAFIHRGHGSQSKTISFRPSGILQNRRPPRPWHVFHHLSPVIRCFVILHPVII